MKKIYVTITKEGFISLLKNRLKDYDIESYKITPDKEIPTSFYSLITSHEHVNVDWLKSLRDYHSILLLDPAKEVPIEGIENVIIFEDESELIDYIVAEPLTNPTIPSTSKGLNKSKQTNQSKPGSKNEQIDTPIETKKVVTAKETAKDKVEVTKEESLKSEGKKQNKDKTVPVDSEEEENEGNPSKPVVLEDYPNNDKKEVENRYKSNSALRKKMQREKLSGNKTIGVWSPLSTGVTTFVVNFAIYFRDRLKKDVSVIEIPYQYSMLQSLLTRYESKPEGWEPFIDNYISENPNNDSVHWGYKGISWFPLGCNDKDWKDIEQIDQYFYATKNTVTFADFPKGKMDKLALYSLEYLDELWILVDDNFHHIKEWKEYIHKLINDHSINAKFIFNREIYGSQLKPISQVKEIEKTLGIKTFITLPNIFEEVQRNNYENNPIIEKLDVYNRLQPHFDMIIKDFFDKDIPENRWYNFKKMFSMLIPHK